jgi:hypothetical protein
MNARRPAVSSYPSWPLVPAQDCHFPMPCGPSTDQHHRATVGSGPVRSRTPAALRSSVTRDRSAGRARQGRFLSLGSGGPHAHGPQILLHRGCSSAGTCPRGRDAQPSNHPAMERYLPHWRASMLGAAVAAGIYFLWMSSLSNGGEDEYGLLLNC